jgi:ubiquinone/menaquinone biosynthesis C-methylase UbiE
MNSSDILNSLNEYKSNEFKSEFLNDTIKYFSYTYKNKKIIKILENECELAGIRLHMLYNTFHFYLSSTKPTETNITYRQLNLSKNQSHNLNHQINGIKKDTFNICGESEFTDNSNAKLIKRYFIISSNNIINKNIQSITQELALGLIGINSLKFLEHQNLNNYCKLWSKSETVFKEFSQYKKKLNKLRWQTRDRIMVFNDMTYAMLGTKSAHDMKLVFINNNSSTSQLNSDEKLLQDFKGNIVHISDTLINTDDQYKYEWFIYKLPLLVGAPDIYTMLINTKYHFYFLGIKCMSIFAIIEKSINQSSWQSFIDIYLLKIINKLDYTNMTCIKNITMKRGTSIINTNDNIKISYDNIKKYSKLWYDIDLTDSYIKDHFKKCTDKFDTIYKNKVLFSDPLVREQIGVHRKISQHYIMKYGYNKEFLIDMGSGKLSGAYIYQKAKIKNVYAVEPSIYSIENAKKVVDKYKNVNFTLIHAFADKLLDMKSLENKKFDIITFIFTIHYMIKNIDVVIANIKKVSKPGTIIIITCVNGDKVLEKLSLSKSYEVKYYNDVFWGVYKFNSNDVKNEQVLFYMKDVYGLEMGSEEYLVPINDLILKFQKNKIRLKYSNSFKNEYAKMPKAQQLKKFQLDILNMQQILVFEI